MYGSTDIQNYFQLCWVLLLPLFWYVCLNSRRRSIQVVSVWTRKEGSGDTHRCHIHGARPQIPQNRTLNPQAGIRTSEAAEVGNHSCQYAEQEKTRIGNPSYKFCIQAFTLSGIQASSRSPTQTEIQIWCLSSWNESLNTYLNCPFIFCF